MAPNADMQFTEGHVRLLLWMCNAHQDWVDDAIAQIMREGETPSDNLMFCREGLVDLKVWSLRLLEVIEATPDDEEDEGEQELTDEHLPELEDFINNLETQWRDDRSAGRRPPHPLSQLCQRVLSIFRRPMAG